MTVSNAYLFAMPSGIAGDLTRLKAADVEAQIADASYPVLRFGEPVKMVSGKIRPITTGDVLANIYGFGVRPYPTQAATSEALGTATPSPTRAFNVLRRGYMTVKCQYGTPVKNATIWVRTIAADDTVAQPIGGIETGSDGGDCFEITNAFFMGVADADADGNVEISYKI